MTRKLLFLFIFCSLSACLALNSCKKDDSTSLNTFLTQKPWKLALKQRYAYLNSVLVRTDTLESSCALTQTLTFNTANTYIYQNYACTNTTVRSNWTFSDDKLYLNLNSIIAINSKKVQNVARIINLGQYSLVFDAGDVNVTPTNKLTDSVIIFRYGFIH